MPPSKDESLQHWITSDQLPRIPRQALEPSEADAFLEYLFSEIARRPQRLSVREAYTAARHLQALAWEAKPGKMRDFLGYLAKVVWGMVAQYASIESGDRLATLEFLRKHRSTYLSGIDAVYGLDELMRYIEEAAPVDQRSDPPNLVGPSRSVQGKGNPQLADDLSERIYAGYHALRRARIQGTNRRIAEVLDRQGLRVRARRSIVSTWSSYEVDERVKQYQDRHRKLPGQRGKEETARWRDAIVDRWILAYRQKQAWEKRVEDSTPKR